MSDKSPYNRIHHKSLFVSESQYGECNVTVLSRKHSRSYVDEQNRHSAPQCGFVAERDSCDVFQN